MERDESKAKGGYARADALSAEERKEIARKAAMARWDGLIPKATHEGRFPIGNTVVAAAVLPNRKRLLTQATFLRALGRSRSPKAGTGILSTVDGTPFFLQADVLKPFITEELMASTTPIFYLDKKNRRMVGYDAMLLPGVAEVYLKFRDSCHANGKSVPPRYEHIITACDMVMRGLARVGIIALIDEATGFEDQRPKDELAEILRAFISEELVRYASSFPLAYFRELCRLKGTEFKPDMKLPRYFGHHTNDIVYSRLAPGVLEELKRKNPADNGRRHHRHYQYLTQDIGHPKLLQHLGSVVTLMKLSPTWGEFKTTLDKIHPVHQVLPLYEEWQNENDQ